MTRQELRPDQLQISPRMAAHGCSSVACQPFLGALESQKARRWLCVSERGGNNEATCSGCCLCARAGTVRGSCGVGNHEQRDRSFSDDRPNLFGRAPSTKRRTPVDLALHRGLQWWIPRSLLARSAPRQGRDSLGRHVQSCWRISFHVQFQR